MTKKKEIIFNNPEGRALTPEEVRERIPAILEAAVQPIMDGRFYKAFDEKGAWEYVKYLYTFCEQPLPSKFYVVENPKEALYKAREVLNKPDYTYSLFFACSLYTTPYLTWHKYFIDNCRPDFEQANVVHELYDLWQNANIFAAVLEDDFAIVSKGALAIHLLDGQLHNDMGPAMEFAYKDHPMDDCYFWKNTHVPEKLIMYPETITREELLSINNAETRRCYMEAMGSLYMEKMDLTPISEETDRQGNPMRLYVMDFPIEGRGGRGESVKLQVLEVVDPSSQRRYTLYPPQSNGEVYKTAMDAKKATFRNEKMAYRQGDVALVNLEQAFDYPLIET